MFSALSTLHSVIDGFYMHKKYFFFDIDGTLSTGLTTMMPESAVKALGAASCERPLYRHCDRDGLQGICSAVAARYGFTDIVADGGWSVTHNGEIVEMESLPAADCIALIERLEQAGIPWAVSPENEKLCVTADKNYLPYAPENYFPVLWDPHFDYTGWSICTRFTTSARLMRRIILTRAVCRLCGTIPM